MNQKISIKYTDDHEEIATTLLNLDHEKIKYMAFTDNGQIVVWIFIDKEEDIQYFLKCVNEYNKKVYKKYGIALNKAMKGDDTDLLKWMEKHRPDIFKKIDSKNTEISDDDEYDYF